jgi:hypothetical protein
MSATLLTAKLASSHNSKDYTGVNFLFYRTSIPAVSEVYYISPRKVSHNPHSPLQVPVRAHLPQSLVALAKMTTTFHSRSSKRHHDSFLAFVVSLQYPNYKLPSSTIRLIVSSVLSTAIFAVFLYLAFNTSTCGLPASISGCFHSKE